MTLMKYLARGMMKVMSTKRIINKELQTEWMNCNREEQRSVMWHLKNEYGTQKFDKLTEPEATEVKNYIRTIKLQK
jgi:hypothetical protein